MEKKKIKPSTYLYPMPVVIVGAKVDEKPNFMTIAWCSIVEHNPPMISVSASKKHFTNEGIKENKSFSVNIPSKDMVKETDYVGLNSGKNTDKSDVFEIFYGDLKTAPMVKQAPLNLECRLADTIDTKMGHEIFIGEIVNVYANDEVLVNGLPKVEKIDPLVYITKDQQYRKLGEVVGKAFKIGKDYKK